MPRKKRARRHKRHHNSRNHFSGENSKIIEDNEPRTCMDNEPSLNITPTKTFNLKHVDINTPSPDLFIDMPKVLLINNANRIVRSHSSSDVVTPNTPIRKRRNVNHESSLGYSGLPFIFNLSDNIMTDVKLHRSNTLDLNESQNLRVRSNSSIPKLHSPGIEKIPLKAEASTQTMEHKEEDPITVTPQFNYDYVLDLNYKTKVLRNTYLNGYSTPIKRLRTECSRTPFSDLKDATNHIQDLNSLQNQQIRHNNVFNNNRIINGEKLRKLQSFNEIILNTPRSINYENCETPRTAEDNAMEQEQEQKHEGSSDDLSGTENSFFTPQLYTGKLASTPIKKLIDKAVGNEDASDKVEVVTCSRELVEDCKRICKSVSSTSTQVENINSVQHIGVQTTMQNNESKTNLVARMKVSVNKRRSYRSLTPTVVYKISPKRDVRLISPIHRIHLDTSESAETIAAIESFARIFAKVKKYHRRYSSKLPAKIIEICTWLGITIKKGLTSLYQFYTEQNGQTVNYLNTSDSNCNNCNEHISQVSSLTSAVEQLSSEIISMKQEGQVKSEKLALLHTEICQLRRELSQFDDIKKELQELKGQLDVRSRIPPPPPPPPPPSLPLLQPLSLSNKPVKVAARKKSNENARPIISLEDILKVKLKKIGDRPSPMRRATEPLVSTALKQVRLRPTISRPHTPSNESPSGTSSASNSPRSSLTRLLTNVDSVCRVKRLRRASTHSFNDFSRRSRRERENYDCDH